MLKNAGHKITVLFFTVFIVGNILFYQNVKAVELSSIERVAASTDMETAIEIALKLNPGKVPAVILVSSTSYHDALAGIPFALQQEAPILWVGKTPKESEPVFNYIKNHCEIKGMIYILGNDKYISKGFETALKELGYHQNQIVRLGGSNHYETAVKIAKKVEYKGNPIVISSGEDYSQFPAVAAWAAAKESPFLFLPSKGTIPESVINYLNSVSKKDKISIQVIGDSKAFPNNVITELKAKVKGLDNDSIHRISGKDSYDLVAKVNEKVWFNQTQTDSNKTPISSITLVTGKNYVSGISGAILAARYKAPLIFIDEIIPKSSRNLLKKINNWNGQFPGSYRYLTILGDYVDLSPKIVSEADSLFTLGKSIEDNAQVWTYAGLDKSTELNYGLVGEDNSIIISDQYFNTLHKVYEDTGIQTLFNSGTILDDYGKPLGAYRDGSVNESRFNCPGGIARDQDGILYIADTGNGAIRRIDQKRNVTTLVKGLKHPTGIVINSKGEIFVTETLEHRILKIDAQGKWTVFAGGGYLINAGEPVGAFADGMGEQAKFNEPQGLAIDNEDIIYVADSANQRIRQVNTEGIVTTIAGSGVELSKNTSYILGGYQDGAGENAKFNFPLGLTVGSDKTIYVADTYNHCIRRITPEGVVSTLAGSIEPGNRNGNAALTRFSYPSHLLILEDGRLIILDKGNALLRVYQPPQ